RRLAPCLRRARPADRRGASPQAYGRLSCPGRLPRGRQRARRAQGHEAQARDPLEWLAGDAAPADIECRLGRTDRSGHQRLSAEDLQALTCRLPTLRRKAAHAEGGSGFGLEQLLGRVRVELLLLSVG